MPEIRSDSQLSPQSNSDSKQSNQSNQIEERLAGDVQQELLKKYRAKISPYLAKLMKQSDAVAKQFLPNPLELLNYGTETPFEEGKNNSGIYGLERVYQDRAVLTPYFECGAYCRYCFKKTRTLAGAAKRMSDQDIEAAIDLIRKDDRIKTVLVTGGDPFLDLKLLKKVLDLAVEIPHVTNIRIGTRNILFNPHTITDEVAEMISEYNRVNYSDVFKSKNIAVGFSLNHADELTTEVVQATHKLIKKGVAVKGQTVLMKNINDNANTMLELMRAFGCIGITPYYLLHCMPVVGSQHFRTSVQKGIDILREMSSFTGSLAPHYVYVTKIGKVRVGANCVLEYKMINGQRYIRVKTQYKAKDFLEYTGKKSLPDLHEEDQDGFIIAHYLDGADGVDGLNTLTVGDTYKK